MMLMSVVVGCAGPSDQVADDDSADMPCEEAIEEKESDLKIAVIIPRPINDGGWCAFAYDGILKIKETLKAPPSLTLMKCSGCIIKMVLTLYLVMLVSLVMRPCV